MLMRPKCHLPNAYEITIYTIRHVLHGEVGHFRRIFQVEGDNSQQPLVGGKTRDILVLYGVEILTDNYSVLSQNTHLLD